MPYTMVTGFPGPTAQVNKAMLQNGVKLQRPSSLPGYHHPGSISAVIEPGVGMTLFQFPAMGRGPGRPHGRRLRKIETAHGHSSTPSTRRSYEAAFGQSAPRAGRKITTALLLMNEFSTRCRASSLLPRGRRRKRWFDALRKAVNALGRGKGIHLGLHAGSHRTGDRPWAGREYQSKPLFPSACATWIPEDRAGTQGMGGGEDGLSSCSRAPFAAVAARPWPPWMCYCWPWTGRRRARSRAAHRGVRPATRARDPPTRPAVGRPRHAGKESYL